MPRRPRVLSYTSGLWPCGVASYQRHLSQALAEFADVETVRLPTQRILGDDLLAVLRQRRRYQHFARKSAGRDAVLIDYTATFWNGSRLGENFFPAFANALKAPTLVILHEDAGRTDPADTSGPFVVRAVKRLAHLALTTWDTRTRHYEAFVAKHLFDFAAHVVAHADTLASVAPGRVTVLPTPVYPLPAPVWSRAEVDARFGLAGKRVAVLFGFPQPSKGFDRAVAALPHLPPDVLLLQVGHSERSQAEAEKLQSQAAGRLVRTGYLTEAELAAVLARVEVAVAPFRWVNHSSSLGHLIGAGVPIVAHRVPAVERLEADGAGICFVDCDNPVSLAAALVANLDDLRERNREYARQHGFAAVARTLMKLIGETR